MRDILNRLTAGNRLQTAKYILIAALAVFTVVVFINSGSSKPFQTVAEKLESAIDTDTLQKSRDQNLKRYYGLNPADYDGVLLYAASYDMSAEELLLIKAKDDSQIHAIEDAVKKRIENRKNDFEGYLPEQAELIEQAQVIVRGDYVFFTASANADKYRSAFLKSL